MSMLKSIIYKTIDGVTFGRGISRQFSGESIRFPARWSRYFATNYEPETFAFLRKQLHQGSTFLDIGAHIGLFSVVAARLVGNSGKVVSFEPTPFTRGVLKEVIRINGCSDRVEVRGEAVSSERGKTFFFDTGDTISVMNSLVKNERSQGKFEVITTSVDEFAKEHSLKVDCMKIDVEGAELDLLKGATKTMTELRPTMLLSLHPPFMPDGSEALKEIWSILKEHRYAMEYNSNNVEEDWFCTKKELFDVNLFPIN